MTIIENVKERERKINIIVSGQREREREIQSIFLYALVQS